MESFGKRNIDNNNLDNLSTDLTQETPLSELSMDLTQETPISELSMNLTQETPLSKLSINIIERVKAKRARPKLQMDCIFFNKTVKQYNLIINVYATGT